MVVEVGVELGFSCALLLDERVWYWGDNSFGQLVSSVAGPVTTPEPVIFE